VRRPDPSAGSSLLTIGIVVVLALLLSVVRLIPSGPSPTGLGSSESDLATDDGGAVAGAEGGGAVAADAGAAVGADAAGNGAQQSGAAAGGRGTAAVGGQCTGGGNGGATDVGVTAKSVKLAATIVADGPGSSFLGPVRTGMNAVVNKVNRAGGICGRTLNLILRNDSWDADRGSQYIKNFVEGEQVFALAVVPSSEGLRAADDYIRAKQVPVVGTDGMIINQYRNPWIWPVATSTISTMHVMAKEAYDRGARVFGLVFDAKYRFGVEGAYAFNQAVKRLTGSDIEGYDPSLKKCIVLFCGLQPGQPAYTREARTVNDGCNTHNAANKRCDFIAYLLEPDTALSFLREGRDGLPALGAAGLGGAQPLFTRSFAENCKSLCDGMWVWTGYNPPIEALASTPAAGQYVNDIRNESASADVTNQFLEGGYLGMSLLVTALEKVGPTLTRANLKSVLDSTTFDSGLSNPLTWKAGDHFANRSAQAFSIQYKQTFNGWRQQTKFIQDPWVGQDIPSGE
jgi:ABC-type branched-subunit amino acid transport system substrate-binding protein